MGEASAEMTHELPISRKREGVTEGEGERDSTMKSKKGNINRPLGLKNWNNACNHVFLYGVFWYGGGVGVEPSSWGERGRKNRLEGFTSYNPVFS